MKNDKPASGTLEIPRRHHGKTLEAPKGGLFSRAASVPPPRPMSAPQAADRTTPRTGDQRQVTGTVRPLSQTTRPSSPSAPVASAPVASAPRSATVSAPRSRPSSPPRSNINPNREQTRAEWIDDVRREAEALRIKIDHGELSGMVGGPLLFIVGGILLFGFIFHLLVGSVIWFMLAILLWSMSNLLNKAQVEHEQGSEAGQLLSGTLARIHPSWANPATVRFEMRILSIVCGVIWLSTSFWS